MADTTGRDRRAAAPLDRRSALKRIIEITGLLNSTLDLDELLRQIMSSAAELLDAETSSLLLVDEETGDLTINVATGESGEQVTRRSSRPHQGIAGWVVDNGEAAVVESPKDDPRFYAVMDQAIQFETRNLIAVPLKDARRDDRGRRGDQQARRRLHRPRPRARRRAREPGRDRDRQRAPLRAARGRGRRLAHVLPPLAVPRADRGRHRATDQRAPAQARQLRPLLRVGVQPGANLPRTRRPPGRSGARGLRALGRARAPGRSVQPAAASALTQSTHSTGLAICFTRASRSSSPVRTSVPDALTATGTGDLSTRRWRSPRSSLLDGAHELAVEGRGDLEADDSLRACLRGELHEPFHRRSPLPRRRSAWGS